MIDLKIPHGKILIGDRYDKAAIRELTGDITLGSDGSTRLKDVITSGTYESPSISVDSKGRIVSAINRYYLGDSLKNGNIFIGNSNDNTSQVKISGDALLSNDGQLLLNTINTNVGTFCCPNITVNEKGLITNIVETDISIHGGKLDSNKVLIGNSEGKSSQSIISLPSTTRKNAILYSSANNEISEIPSEANSFLITTQDGRPTFSKRINFQNGSPINPSVSMSKDSGLYSSGSNVNISAGSVLRAQFDSETSIFTPLKVIYNCSELKNVITFENLGVGEGSGSISMNGPMVRYNKCSDIQLMSFVKDADVIQSIKAINSLEIKNFKWNGNQLDDQCISNLLDIFPNTGTDKQQDITVIIPSLIMVIKELIKLLPTN